MAIPRPGAATMSEVSTTGIAARYASEALLGKGGAGEVHRALDRTTGKLVALKRLRLSASDRRSGDLALFFEREFHTLAQLEHPGIVEVYDYGVEGGEPYYTMELLDGSDLRDLAPLPWRRAAAIVCEVASALALLHSRRLVHRDLTPRNVRVTTAGRAKLLDFGAMTAMGAIRQLVGTPAYAAPEHVTGQELDARSDLFGLGALAYWALTGRHAFTARRFRDLAAAWLTRPPAPSAIVADIPAELDALVLSLLSIDAAGRPASAAQVIARLRALTDQPGEQTSEDAHAYLATPVLVGRAEALAALQRCMQRAMHGEGGSVLISGAPGTGRSRLLGALVLEAKVGGALVLKANATEGGGEEYGLARALVDQLIELAPERAYHPPSAALAPLDALAACFMDAAAERTLCVAVDDLEKADGASIAVLLRLSTLARDARILVAVSADVDTSPALERALIQLEHNGTRIALAPLTRAESEVLLRSVFGDVPGLLPIAGFIHELSGGRPESCLELAQHLVDRKIASFVDGAFRLPHTLEGLSLPASYEQALEQRIAALSPCARSALDLLALSTRAAPLTIADQLELLSSEFSHSQIFAALDELVRERIAVQDEARDRLRDGSIARVVERALSEERKRTLHALLARHREAVGGVAQGVIGYHLLQSGDFRRSLEAHAARSATDIGVDSPDVAFERGEFGGAYLEQLYAVAKQQQLSPRELFPLQKHLVALAVVANVEHGRHVDDLLPQLVADSGLIFYADHADKAPLERIVACMQDARARHDATPEPLRGLSPIEALRELTAMVGILIGLSARTMDMERAARLPALLAPFLPLSPLIGLVQRLATNSLEALLHATDVREERDELLATLSTPIPGFDELTRTGAVQLLSFYQALEFAVRGSPRALELVAAAEKVEYYAPLASQVRVVYFLIHGDGAGVQRAREQRAALVLLHADADQHLIRSSFYESMVAYLCGDLVVCRQLADVMAREAASHPGWRPWHAYTVALVETLRGDHEAALRSIERVFATSSEVGHAARVLATMLEVDLLARGLEPERAVRKGHELLARRQAEQRPLTWTLVLDLGLALAETRTGDYVTGAARLERASAQYESSGGPAVPLSLLAIQRARIALLAGDEAAFTQHADRAARLTHGLRHPGLVARLQQLVSEARKAQHAVGPELARTAEMTTGITVTRRSPRTDEVRARLASVSTRERRAELALELVLRDAKAPGGCLLARVGGELRLLAAQNMADVDEVLTTTARSLVERALASESEHTQVAGTATSEEAMTSNVLSHHGAPLQAFLLYGADDLGGVLLLLAPEPARLRVHSDLLRSVGEALAAD